MVRGLPVAAFVCLLAACTLPQRDNPVDPQNRLPLEVYVVVAGGHSDVGSHGATWTLDASAACPTNDGCAGRFAWDVDGDPSNGFELAAQGAVVTTKFPVTAAAFAGVASVPWQVRVRRDDGKVGFANVVLTNDAPIADPGEDVFAATGRGERVVLDACGGAAAGACTTSDPDGDPVAYTWTWLNDDGSIAPVVSGATVTFTAPQSEHSYFFLLEVSDGVRTSSAVARAFVEDTVWISYANPGRLFRVTKGPTGVATPLTSIGACAGSVCNPFFLAWDAATSKAWISVRRSVAPYDRVFRHDGNFSTDPYWDLPAVPMSGQIVAASDRALVALSSAPWLSLLSGAGVVTTVSGPTGNGVVASGGNDGSFWFAQSYPSPMIARLEPGATSLTVLPGVGTEPRVVGTDGDALLVLDGNPPTAILRVAPDGTYSSRPAPAGLFSPISIAAGARGSTWIVDDDANTSHRRLFAVDTAGNAVASTDIGLLSSTTFISSLPDGSVWVSDESAGDATRFVFENDAVVAVDVVNVTDLPITGSGGGGYEFMDGRVDPNTAVLHTLGWNAGNPQIAQLGEIPVHRGGLLDAGPDVHPGVVSVDPSHGSAWYADADSVRRISPHGRLLASYTFPPPNAGEFVTVRAVTALADGGALAAWTSNLQDAFFVQRLAEDATPVGTAISILPQNAGDAPSYFAMSAPENGRVCAAAGWSLEAIAQRIDVGQSSATALSPSSSQILTRPGVDATGGCWWTDGSYAYYAGPAATTATMVNIAGAGVDDGAIAVGPRDGALYVRARYPDDRLWKVTTGGVTLLSGVPAGIPSSIAVVDCAADASCTDLWFTADAKLYRARVTTANSLVLEGTPLDLVAPSPDAIRALRGDGIPP